MKKPCKITDCDGFYMSGRGGGKGLCCKHYRRLLRHGSPHKYKRIENPKYLDDGSLLSKGYAYVRCNGKSIKKARVMMAEYLGRPLLSSEIIHHINFNKLDDFIENFQIVSRSEHIKIHKLPGANKLRYYAPESERPVSSQVPFAF